MANHEGRRAKVPIKGSAKEKRQYEKIKKSSQKSGRYGKRAEEVAARTVMKQRSKKKSSSKKSGSKKKSSSKKGGSRKKSTSRKKSSSKKR
jgi:hypothetical protein